MLFIVLALCVNPKPKWPVGSAYQSCSGYITPWALYTCAESTRFVYHNSKGIVAQTSITYMSGYASPLSKRGAASFIFIMGPCVLSHMGCVALIFPLFSHR